MGQWAHYCTPLYPSSLSKHKHWESHAVLPRDSVPQSSLQEAREPSAWCDDTLRRWTHTGCGNMYMYIWLIIREGQSKGERAWLQIRRSSIHPSKHGQQRWSHLGFLIVFHHPSATSPCEDEAFIPTAPICFVLLKITTDLLKEDGKANPASLEDPGSFQNKRPCGELDHCTRAPSVSQSSLKLYSRNKGIYSLIYSVQAPTAAEKPTFPYKSFTFMLARTSRLILARLWPPSELKQNLYCHLRTLVILSRLDYCWLLFNTFHRLDHTVFLSWAVSHILASLIGFQWNLVFIWTFINYVQHPTWFLPISQISPDFIPAVCLADHLIHHVLLYPHFEVGSPKLWKRLPSSISASF